ncbi:DUF2845 domain-containing protein [Acinetobacter bohemicus]|uniref:DUF2845 domain-containing protein n=1 Tax=Acinetobacter bohemicus TaxID=1435036 RepID=UPI001A484AB5|nr:DUF2845 domain-containing protein [Acinetobacter bohemicus]CAD9195570.1 hypothetical protein QAC21B_01696 [Acinetobacter bohemicus]
MNLIMWGNKKMFIKLILILSVLVSVNAMAGDVYTCTVSGKTVYQGKPCAGSKALNDKVNQAKAQHQAKVDAKDREEREWNSKVEPKVGMTKSEAEKSRWGYPDKINTTTTANNEFEQWVYRTHYTGSRYLHFTNGRITSITN